MTQEQPFGNNGQKSISNIAAVRTADGGSGNRRPSADAQRINQGDTRRLMMKKIEEKIDFWLRYIDTSKQDDEDPSDIKKQLQLELALKEREQVLDDTIQFLIEHDTDTDSEDRDSAAIAEQLYDILVDHKNERKNQLNDALTDFPELLRNKLTEFMTWLNAKAGQYDLNTDDFTLIPTQEELTILADPTSYDDGSDADRMYRLAEIESLKIVLRQYEAELVDNTPAFVLNTDEAWTRNPQTPSTGPYESFDDLGTGHLPEELPADTEEDRDPTRLATAAEINRHQAEINRHQAEMIQREAEKILVTFKAMKMFDLGTLAQAITTLEFMLTDTDLNPEFTRKLRELLWRLSAYKNIVRLIFKCHQDYRNTNSLLSGPTFTTPAPPQLSARQLTTSDQRKQAFKAFKAYQKQLQKQNQQIEKTELLKLIQKLRLEQLDRLMLLGISLKADVDYEQLVGIVQNTYRTTADIYSRVPDTHENPTTASFKISLSQELRLYRSLIPSQPQQRQRSNRQSEAA